MAKTLSAAQARNNFADVIGQAHFGDETVIIERLGKPFAVVIGFKAYQKLLKAQARRQKSTTESTASSQDQARLF